MPILDGLETLKMVKQKYTLYQDKQIQRPMICHLSQTNYSVMQSFLYEDEEPDFYLNKPISHSELAALLQLLRIR